MNEILSDKNHRIILGMAVILTILAGIWKFSTSHPHVSARQQAIENATRGF